MADSELHCDCGKQQLHLFRVRCERSARCRRAGDRAPAAIAPCTVVHCVAPAAKTQRHLSFQRVQHAPRCAEEP